MDMFPAQRAYLMDYGTATEGNEFEIAAGENSPVVRLIVLLSRFNKGRIAAGLISGYTLI